MSTLTFHIVIFKIQIIFLTEYDIGWFLCLTTIYLIN